MVETGKKQKSRHYFLQWNNIHNGGQPIRCLSCRHPQRKNFSRRFRSGNF